MSALVQSQAEGPWRRFLPGLLLVAAVLLVFLPTAQAMVWIWYRSGTFAHAFLVPPISAWLVWRQREKLVGVPVRPAPWMLLPLAVLCLLWLVGELAAAQALTQFSLVAMLVVCVPLALGLSVARVLMFPLLFLFFAVPLGEALVPVMMEWTADFTVAAVSFSGVPVYREGFQFIVPTGRWSVVEACSGVRYLIASAMVGTLFAYLNFNSYRRRVQFIGLALLVPLVANWVRAYMIVMLGHLSNNKIAAGVDHIIYGWVFFGVVIGMMFFIGARWSDPAGTPAAARDAAPVPAAQPAGAAAWLAHGLAIGLAVLVMAGTQLASRQLGPADQTGAAPRLALPAAAGGWSAEEPSATAWTPAFKGARAVASKTYRKGDEAVTVWVGYYRDQTYDNKLVTSTNVLAEASAESDWAQMNHGARALSLPSGDFKVQVADVQATLGSTGAAGQRLRAWQVYWVGGRFIAGDSRARLQLALDRLLGRGDDGAVVVFHTDGSDSQRADTRLDSFTSTAVPSLAAQLDATRAQR